MMRTSEFVSGFPNAQILWGRMHMKGRPGCREGNWEAISFYIQTQTFLRLQLFRSSMVRRRQVSERVERMAAKRSAST